MEAVLPDILAERLAVVFAGINPGLTAAGGHHFASGTNRFWRAIHHAGFTAEQLPTWRDREILHYGCGLTTVVARPTARADQLSAQDFAASAAPFEAKIRHYTPRFIGFLGKAAYCAINGRRDVAWGLQPDRFGAAQAWILPNPSGRNRAFSFAQLVDAYRALYCASNIERTGSHSNA